MQAPRVSPCSRMSDELGLGANLPEGGDVSVTKAAAVGGRQ